MALLISGLTFASVSLAIFAGYRLRYQAKLTAARLQQFADPREEQTKKTRKIGEIDGLFKRILQRITLQLSVNDQEQRWAKLRRQLTLAGNPGDLKPQEFIVLKLTLCALTLVAGFLLLISFLNVVILAAAAWLAPELYLHEKIKNRQLAITLAIPDVLDLLTVSVEAGLGFDAAVAKVIEKVEGPLADEFRRMLYEMRIGRSRREALRDLSERTGVPYLQNFASAVIQADQLGVSISKVLRIQSQEIRRQRRQKAEEEAMKAPIKMLLPLVALVFPSLFIVLLGPAILQFAALF
ncbi:MAG: type II secretion system F family protein [Firmicutes bacterium]|nr:type II secretion system F family protein [Bacillota bacterium]